LAKAPQAATSSNNTITGNSVGIYVSNSTNHAITLNVVSGNSGQGILYVSSTAGGKAENNVITNSGYGVVYQSAGGDFGGGPSSSVGGNVISCNTNADFWTNQLGPTYAANNLWDHVPPTFSSTSASGGVDIFASQGSGVVVSTGAGLAPSPCP